MTMDQLCKAEVVCVSELQMSSKSVSGSLSLRFTEVSILFVDVQKF